ncbi:MAG: hypothetical protein H6Q77_2143 [Gemmatimonadetes bacterium]|jgi:hypothetical protein|nr:hypothetical protein [Gemmatimonadota bacterium]
MPPATAPRWRHLVRWGLPAALVLAALVYHAAQRRGTVLEAALRDWAINEVSGATDSVYQLSVGGLRLSVFPGRITFDSMRLSTDTMRNDFRADPYPVLTATAAGCRLMGIDTWRLMMARGVSARLFRCDEIKATVFEVVRDRPPVQPAVANPRGGVPFVRDSIELPALLPTIILRKTELPRVSLDYRRRVRGGAETRVHLERLNVQLRGTRIDPSVPPEARRPLFSDQAVVTADTLKVVEGTDRAVMLGRLRANLTDSTLALDSIIMGPPQSDAEWVKAQQKRTDLIRLQLDSARFHGVDYRRLGSIEGAMVVRRAMLHGFKLDVLSDKRLPAGPARTRRTPQQWVASLERPLAVDTVIFVGGRIGYSEHAVGRSQPGTMSWEKIAAQVTDIRTVPRVGETTPPMVVQASALVLGQGKLETTIEIPLTAARFDMNYSGTLGPMDITAFNAYTARVMPMRLAGGTLQAVRVRVVVQNGRSVGQVVPLYQDFKVALEDKKAGFFKKAGLSVASFFANAFKVRGENPGKAGEEPRIGRINYPYRPTASLPQVFWYALRQGMVEVFVK